MIDKNGKDWWDGHQKQINYKRRNLKEALNAWDKSSCGGPPPGAKEAYDRSENSKLEDEWKRRQNQSERNGMPDMPIPIPIPPIPISIPPSRPIRVPVLIMIPTMLMCAMNPAYCRPQRF